MFKNLYEKVKAWFKNSATILIARLTYVIGFLVAVIGAMDWSPLLTLNLSSGFDSKQVLFLGLTMFLQGVGVELARRRSL